MIGRRTLLGGAAAVFAGLLTGFATRARAAVRAIRPPGALPPGAFERQCIRCFRCAEVCPTHAIRFESRASPAESELPVLHLRERACILCMACTEACPTGALQRVPAAKVRMGTPVLERRDCISWRGEGVCRLCYDVCPYPDQAVALVGPRLSPSFDASACVGCGLCEQACPDVAHAIHIEAPR